MIQHLPRPVRIDPEVELEGKIATTLECLVEALRTPEDYPARQEYINVMLAKADVYLADRGARFAGSIAA